MNRLSASILDAPRGVSGDKGLVVSQHYAASQAGADVLTAGGSAVDAAVATAFVLGVIEPWMSGLGGIGYLLVGRLGQEPEAIDFPAKSPSGARAEDYPIVGGTSDDFFAWDRVKEDRNVKGALSVCAPMMAPGLELAWSRHGNMPWKDLLGPATRLAKDGFPIDWYTQLMIGSAASDLQSDRDAAALFLCADGTGKSSGWTAAHSPVIRQTKLAETLDVLARDGSRTCVEGDIAQALVADIRQKGGVLNLKDFTGNQPVVAASQPLDLGKGRTVWTVPGLSGGVTVSAMIQAWRDMEEGQNNADILESRALCGVEVIEDRLTSLGDSPEHATSPSCTTSFCIVDQTGLVVAATLTLVSIFGAKLLSPSTGILMNNAMSWFDPVAGNPNSIGPSLRPLSSMAPTLVSDGAETLTAIAASGGRRIVPAISQVLAYMTLDGYDLDAAMTQPRFDLRGDRTVIVDARLPVAEFTRLKAQTDVLTTEPTIFPYHFGLVSSAQYRSDGGGLGCCEVLCPNAMTVCAGSDGI